MFAPEIDDLLGIRHGLLIESMQEFASEIAPDLDTDKAKNALARLDAEAPNIISALDAFNLMPGNEYIQPATELYLGIGRYLDIRGMWRERHKWGWSLIPTDDDGDLVLNDVRLVNSIACAYDRAGNYDRAITFYRLALKVAEVQSQPSQITVQLYVNLGIALWQHQQLDEALYYTAKAYELEKEHNNQRGIANALVNLGNIFYAKNKIEESIEFTHAALYIAEETNDLHLRAQTNMQLALSMTVGGLFEAAQPFYLESMRLFEKIGDEIGLADSKLVYSLWHALYTKDDEGLRMARESAQLMQQHDPLVFRQVLELLAEIDALVSKDDRAE